MDYKDLSEMVCKALHEAYLLGQQDNKEAQARFEELLEDIPKAIWEELPTEPHECPFQAQVNDRHDLCTCSLAEEYNCREQI